MGLQYYWRLDEEIPDEGVRNEVTGQLLGFCENILFGQPTIIGDGTSAFFQTNLSSRIETGINVRIRPTCTIEAWAELTNDFTLPYLTIFTNRTDTETDPWFGIHDRRLSVIARDASAGITTEVQSLNQILLNEWYHFVWTNDGSTSKLYINGVLDVTLPQSKPLLWSGIGSIGLDPSSPAGNGFWGYIDEVAVYDHVLTADRILAHFLLGPISTHLSVISGTGKFSKVLEGLGSLDSVEVEA